MALTLDEIMALQAELFALKADSTSNPAMTYSPIASRNKGLNPNYYSGNSSKLVNILNSLYEKSNSAVTSVNKLTNKVNGVLLDTELYSAEWEKLKELMGKDTIVEGLINLYEDKLPSLSGGGPLEYMTTDDIDSIINKL